MRTSRFCGADSPRAARLRQSRVSDKKTERMGGIVAHAYAAAMARNLKFTTRPPSPKTTFGDSVKVVRGLCLLLGPCFLLLAVGLALRIGLTHDGLSADGTVVSMVTEHDVSKGVDTYAPAFIFHTEEGRQYKVISQVAKTPPEFTVGDHVSVVYEKSHPEAARIASFVQVWFFPMISGGFGVSLSGLGLLLALGERWMARKPPSQKSSPAI